MKLNPQYPHKIFIADLPKGTKYKKLQRYVGSKVRDFRVNISTKKQSKNHLSGVIELKSKEDYEYLLYTKFVYKKHTCQLRPYLTPNERKQFNRERLNRRIVINNLLPGTTEEDVRIVFQAFGSIEKIFLKVNENHGPHQGSIHGFVTFKA